VADLAISDLGDAAALTGAELVEVVQTGTNVKTTTQDIADLFVPPPSSPGAVDQLAVVTTTVTVTGVTAETGLFSQNVVAGTLDVDDVLHLNLYGDLQNNSGGAATYTLRTKLGGTTVMATAALSVASGGTRRNWNLDFQLTLRGVADSYGFEVVNVTNAAAAGSTNTVALLHAGYTGQVTVDFDAADRLVEATVQPNTAGTDFRLFGGFLRRIST
jgi:hypothetical protein